MNWNWRNVVLLVFSIVMLAWYLKNV